MIYIKICTINHMLLNDVSKIFRAYDNFVNCRFDYLSFSLKV